jgi:hypothetical protein
MKGGSNPPSTLSATWTRSMTRKFRRMANAIMKACREAMYPREKMQVVKRQTRFTYTDGPMYFLGQQIVKQMEDAGYPAKIVWGYRSAAQQQRLYDKGRTTPGPDVSPERPLGRIVTKAKPWRSPHNYLEAVDIAHPSKGWNVSDEYWETLAACTRIVEQRFDVDLTGGLDWGWDLAHIELADWRIMRDMKFAHAKQTGEMIPPTPKELWWRFEQVLPKVAKRHKNSVAFQEPLA